MTSPQQQLLQEALKNIEKQFGKGALIRMGDNATIGQVNTFHSGSYILDLILGGGYPEGRVIELYGPESSGKTTLALHAIASVQASGGIAALIDAEHALDPVYARKLGVDIDNLLLSQPNDGEQALQIAEELAKTGVVKLIVVDSVAALVPRAEVEGDMGDSFMGLQARMMSQGLRKLTSVLAKTGTSCIFINQIRMKIGVLYGNPETTPGGNALRFFASQRIETRKGETVSENKEDTGIICKITTKKNKIFAPFKKADVRIMWAKGIDKSTDIVEAGLLLGLITRAGAFYSFGDQKFQGKEKVIEFLASDTKGRDTLEKHIREKIRAMRSGEKVYDENVVLQAHDEEQTD
ncbi:MAG: recombinase RecA [Candidatus Absconditabacterales bacterium]|nr:recombinase RecA [Candidatus Absconditabacterales bacterium]